MATRVKPAPTHAFHSAGDTDRASASRGSRDTEYSRPQALAINSTMPRWPVSHPSNCFGPASNSQSAQPATSINSQRIEAGGVIDVTPW